VRLRDIAECGVSESNLSRKQRRFYRRRALDADGQLRSVQTLIQLADESGKPEAALAVNYVIAALERREKYVDDRHILSGHRGLDVEDVTPKHRAILDEAARLRELDSPERGLSRKVKKALKEAGHEAGDMHPDSIARIIREHDTTTY